MELLGLQVIRRTAVQQLVLKLPRGQLATHLSLGL